MDEILVLQEQLEELLVDPPHEPDEALELAMVAGLLARLSPDCAAMRQAESWRDGPGQALLDEAWEELDAEEHLEALEDVLAGEGDATLVEEALYDLDELAAAAAWSGSPEVVRPIALRVADEIRMMADLFAEVAPLARDMAREGATARDLDLYAFWLAAAEADAAEE